MGLSHTFIADLAKVHCIYWYGIFPSDEIPTSILSEKNFSIIVNTATRQQRIGHFVALSVDGKHIAYFDPLGLPPMQANINQFVDKCKEQRQMIVNDNQIQPSESQLCGLYCIAFLILRKTYPCSKLISAITNVFNVSNPQNNDAQCISYLHKLMR